MLRVMLDSNGAFNARRPAAPPESGPDVGALARVHGVAAIKRLVEILEGGDVATSVEAAKVLLAYGYGQPVQPLVFDTGGVVVEINANGETGQHRMNGESAGTSWNVG
jgi:hypothetical protein